ncbi:MAG: hypothetical protein CL878_01595 [Dehalococcoidia bacterium]|nr:hypothetical protein [Dehalococcoidia bacterium]
MSLVRLTKLLDTAWPALALVLLVAFVVRLGYVLTLENALNVTFEADPITYDQLARNLLAGQPYVGASFYFPAGTENPTALWDPLYPLFLAAIYALVGHDFLAVRLVQVALAVASCGLLYVLGRSIFGPRTALVGAGFAAIYPFFIYYTGQLLTETLFTFLMLFLLTLAHYVAEGRFRGATAVVALGITAGLTVLARAEALYFAVILVAALAWWAVPLLSSGAPDLRARLISLVALVAVFAATLAPWVVFNYARFDRLFVSTKLGYNLYKYYHPRMTPDQRVRSDDIPLPDLTGLSEPEREDRLLSEGLGFMTDDPARTVRFMAAKAGLLFKLTPSNEINRRYAVVSLLSYGVLVPFMVIGAVMSLRRWPLTWPLLLWVAMGSASGILVFAGIRLRMRIEPILLLFAAVGVVKLGQWLWSRRTGL